MVTSFVFKLQVLIQQLSETRFLSDVPLDGLYSIAVNSKTSTHQVGSTIIGESVLDIYSQILPKFDGVIVIIIYFW